MIHRHMGVGISHCAKLAVSRKTTQRPRTPPGGHPKVLQPATQSPVEHLCKWSLCFDRHKTFLSVLFRCDQSQCTLSFPSSILIYCALNPGRGYNISLYCFQTIQSIVNNILQLYSLICLSISYIYLYYILYIFIFNKHWPTSPCYH